MITPNPFSGSQYYKIGDWVTFAWNYTSLSATPTAIDVLASCSKNSATYTIALNQSVKETGQVLWDTGAYQSSATVPLLTEVYTLIIYDADSSVSATARAGYLGTFEQFTFGMYSPQPYTPWSSTSFAEIPLLLLYHSEIANQIPNRLQLRHLQRRRLPQPQRAQRPRRPPRHHRHHRPLLHLVRRRRLRRPVNRSHRHSFHYHIWAQETALMI